MFFKCLVFLFLLSVYNFFQFAVFVSDFVNSDNPSMRAHVSECARMCACVGAVATAVSVSVPLLSLSCCPAPHTAVPPFSPTHRPPHLLAWLTDWLRRAHEGGVSMKRKEMTQLMMSVQREHYSPPSRPFAPLKQQTVPDSVPWPHFLSLCVLSLETLERQKILHKFVLVTYVFS